MCAALTPGFELLLAEIDDLIERPLGRDETLEAICGLLKEQVAYYDWVGFYRADPYAERELVLGPYVGAPTEHTRIPFGEGICGRAADTEQTFVVQDVSLETNYLSCSPDVRSEIVVPILRDGEILGELDIDSHALAPFTAEDRRFLERVCRRVAPLL